ncbi:putative photosynthetic complex assembly protein 2 [Roseiarcus fermentans]|uniref:Putative photosynthetic complex assembly protein 2 n=2 Tax=Roseiarcus fermentans TaxID=1473586 RepID=A0A366FBK9_9HYPH|nr:putative photosynthetic complex assembly protein 2 [Roseiarcus fermentans]
MCPYATPFLVTVALWWSSTGLILLLDSQERRTYAVTMIGATGLLAGALWIVALTAGETTGQSAYVAFACGLAVWGWQLLGFYTGFLSGSNKSPCAPGSTASSRFFQALGASLHHELAALLGAVALGFLTWGQPNTIALWTYVILWVMHSSAKLNLFLGVPNLGADMLPDHLAFLTSFMARKPMNALFPVSVTGGTACAALLLVEACRSGASAFDTVGLAMLGSLMALAVVEHWFLVVPLDGNALWRAFRRRAADCPRATANRVERELAGAHEQTEGAGVDARIVAFRADPPHVCDARNIERLLESIAAGSFGAVECVHGLVRTEADWLCFELTEGRARMAAFGPRMQKKPLVIARGQGFDRARLKAAFDGCAAAA